LFRGYSPPKGKQNKKDYNWKQNQHNFTVRQRVKATIPCLDAQYNGKYDTIPIPI